MPDFKQRICVIRLRDGRRLEFKDAEVPSTQALMIFFKRRKEKRRLANLASLKGRLADLQRDRIRRREGASQV
ncbi:hypothetical protein GGD66_006603 [Bradyrhizobium sp. CIR48]|uniref:hypothetical protein n=1 Tax=Bradyrhizobium sp. CIR48 TaxID=2663840 RepID=UPI0016058473|nr:hypothetical protein [Bradyrhizobium sp. CIR48]MBB4428017.1 hypothetical protein [Bradyrhizobium sp. CIR48]